MESYWEIIDDVAQGVYDDLKENPEADIEEIIFDNLDRFLIYYSDQADILSAMLIKGVINWGRDIDWDSIYMEIIDDVHNELEVIKQQEKEKNERI